MMPTCLTLYFLIGFIIGACLDAALILGAGSLGELNLYFWALCAIVLVLFTVAWLPILILAFAGWALQTMGFI